MTRGFLIDLHQAVRSLARAPGFTAVAILTLGVGLGLATAIYAALKQVVIDPLPFPDADRLMVLLSEVPGSGTDDVWGASTAQFFHFRDNAESLEETGVMRGTIPVDASIGGAEMRLGVMLASASVQRMIGARAILGRTLTDADDQPGAPITAVLSEGFWRSQLGADPELVGKSLAAQVGAETPLSVEIVGVVASTGSASFDETDAWWPNQLDPSGPHYNQHDLFLLAKRRPGLSAAAAQAEADGLTDQLAGVYPDVYGTLELESGKVDFMEQFGFPQSLDPAQGLPCGRSVRAVVDRPRRDRAAARRRLGGHSQPVLGARRDATPGDRRTHCARGGSRGNSPATGLDEHVDRCREHGSSARGSPGGSRRPGRSWIPLICPAPRTLASTAARWRLAAGVALLLVLSLVATSVWRLRGVAGHLTDAGRGCDLESNSPAYAVALDRGTGRLGVRAPGRCRPVAVEFPQSRGCGPGHRPAWRGEGQPRAGQ